MVSLEKKFIFVHIPKTGGNSIQNLLKEYSEDSIFLKSEEAVNPERFNVFNPKYNTNKHSPLYVYKSNMEHDLYHSMYKFSIIRNPWDRMVSLFFSPGLNEKSEWNRERFVSMVRCTPTMRWYLSESSFWGMVDRAQRKIGLNLLSSKRGILDANVRLLKFEKLDSEYEALCDSLDIPHTLLPRVNKSSRNHYSKYYDDELRNMIARKFSDEIKFGRYTFEDVA